tara:strand:+ start:291 stop:545 length:255 start_codon:yes stop_codon:yes gene_type:complete
MARLINKTNTRKFILAIANEHAENSLPDEYIDGSGRKWNYSRCGKTLKQFTSVSGEFIEDLDRAFRVLIEKKIKSMPLRGKTVK